MRIILKPSGVALLMGVLLLLLGTSIIAIRRSNDVLAANAAVPQAPSAAVAANPAPLPEQEKGPIAINNGAFTGGGALPDGWTNLPWMGEGEAKLARDTTVFHTAPAALRLEGTTARTYTALDHRLTGYHEGDAFTVRGWMRVAGAPQEATIGIRGRAVEGDIAPQTEWFHVADARTAATGWLPFEQKVTLKPGSKYAYLVTVLRGKGSLWIDDVEVIPQP